MLFEQVCIVGLGLIGASLAQAIKDRQLVGRLVAVDKHAPSIEAAIAENVIDAGSDSLFDVVAGSDFIIVAVPVKTVATVFKDINQAMQQGLIEADCIISDVSSTKLNVWKLPKLRLHNYPPGLSRRTLLLVQNSLVTPQGGVIYLSTIA